MARRFSAARLAGVMLMGAAIAAPLPAQGWQGIVVFKTSGNRSRAMGDTLTMYVRPGVVRLEPQGKTESPMGPSVIIMRYAERTTTVVLPSRQMYIDMPMPNSDSIMKANIEKSKVTKTGRTEVVAGHTCQYYHDVDEDGKQWDVCLASDMGTFMMMSAMGRQSQPAWERAFGSQNLFPIKVVDGQGQVEMVALSIQSKHLDDALFVPPPGYKKTDFGAMMGGMMHKP